MTVLKDLLSPSQLTQLRAGTNANNLRQNSRRPPIAKLGFAALPSRQSLIQQVKQFGTVMIDDDKRLFMQAMTGVTPLKNRPAAITDTITNNRPANPNLELKRRHAQGLDTTQSPALSDMQAMLNPVASEALLLYKRPNLSQKTFKQLRQGKLPYEYTLDLHGESRDDARESLLNFLCRSQNSQTCEAVVVKIIHGKGTSLLKTCVNGWLRQLPSVLAFASAPNKAGGTGAVLALLKPNQNPPALYPPF